MIVGTEQDESTPHARRSAFPPTSTTVSSRVVAAVEEAPSSQVNAISPQAPVQLAELQETVLDEGELRALLADVATYGKVLEVTAKVAQRGQSEVISRLPELYLKLVERRIFGAQLRYEFKGATWLDTLITSSAGVRLVRVELPK